MFDLIKFDVHFQVILFSIFLLQVIDIIFDEVDLEYSWTCEYDFLEVYDGRELVIISLSCTQLFLIKKHGFAATFAFLR